MDYVERSIPFARLVGDGSLGELAERVAPSVDLRPSLVGRRDELANRFRSMGFEFMPEIPIWQINRGSTIRLNFEDVDETGSSYFCRSGKIEGGASCSLTPDNRLLYVGFNDGMLRVFDTVTRELVTEFHAMAYSCDIIKFSPCGQYFITASKNSSILEAVKKRAFFGPDFEEMPTLIVWDANSNKQLNQIGRRMFDLVYSVDFHPSKSVVLVGQKPNATLQTIPSLKEVPLYFEGAEKEYLSRTQTMGVFCEQGRQPIAKDEKKLIGNPLDLTALCFSHSGFGLDSREFGLLYPTALAVDAKERRVYVGATNENGMGAYTGFLIVKTPIGEVAYTKLGVGMIKDIAVLENHIAFIARVNNEPFQIDSDTKIKSEADAINTLVTGFAAGIARTKNNLENIERGEFKRILDTILIIFDKRTGRGLVRTLGSDEGSVSVSADGKYMFCASDEIQVVDPVRVFEDQEGWSRINFDLTKVDTLSDAIEEKSRVERP
ncbi:MAG: hypothetical protein AAFN77_19160 [Planctomycetota bacterium]